MNLKDTYLKYDESITEEVFDKIVSLLNDKGFKYIGSGAQSYNSFINLRFIKTYLTKKWQCVSKSCIDDQVQITVTDILGEGWDKKEYSVGDWVCANGKHHTFNNDSFPTGVAWKIGSVRDNAKEPDNPYIKVDKSSTKIAGSGTSSNAIRHATPEEIAKAKGETKEERPKPKRSRGANKKEDTSDSLLNEAKRRYPVGTKFISPESGRKYTVENNTHREYPNGNVEVDKVPWLYWNGKWAEIIESPEIKGGDKGDNSVDNLEWETPSDVLAAWRETPPRLLGMDKPKPRVTLLRKKTLTVKTDNEVKIKIKKR